MDVFKADSLYPGDLPNNLPSNLIFRCENPRFWIFADKQCDNMNDCEDYLDETGVCKFPSLLWV